MRKGSAGANEGRFHDRARRVGRPGPPSLPRAARRRGCRIDELEHAYEEGDRAHFEADLSAWRQSLARKLTYLQRMGIDIPRPALPSPSDAPPLLHGRAERPGGSARRSRTAARSDSSSSVVTPMRPCAKSLWSRPSTTDHAEPSERTGNPNARPSGTPYSPSGDHRQRRPVAFGRRAHDARTESTTALAADAADDGAPRLDDLRAALLDGGDELALEPRRVRDDLGGRRAVDAGVLEVGELRGRVVAPDGHARHRRHRRRRPGEPAGSGPGSGRGGSWRRSGRRGSPGRGRGR